MNNEITIREVDPAEAAHDPLVAYALRDLEAYDRGEGSFVELDLDELRNRPPKFRKAALGDLLHMLVCDREFCDGSGGSSSISYSDGHRDWVDRIDELRAALARERIGLYDPEFHELVPDDSSVILDEDAAGIALGVAIHRAWCAEPVLMPDGCGTPDNDAACLPSFRVAAGIDLGMVNLALVDLSRVAILDPPGS